MVVYLDVAFFMNFAVDLLLLLGTERLAGHPVQWGRTIAGAVFGGVYGAACLVPGIHFLGNALWRIVSLALMGAVAFGVNRESLRRIILFTLLSMALGGLAASMTAAGILPLLAAGGGLYLLVHLWGKPGQRRFVRVKVKAGERIAEFLALCDTGNTLKDPISGRPVLVVGADIAKETLGISSQDLQDPVRTLETIHIHPLRLIPYRAVGKSGLLLAARFDEVWIDGKQSGTLVAFAPEQIGRGEGYQALTGGVF